MARGPMAGTSGPGKFSKRTDGLEFKASETGVVDEVELKAARNEMGEDKYRQEFECSFDAAVEGSYRALYSASQHL